MPINRLNESSNIYDITTAASVLSAVADQDNDKKCLIYLEIGTGDDRLDGSGGIFELATTIGGFSVQPNPQEFGFGTSFRANVKTGEFIIPAGKRIVVTLQSPNPADTNVGVTAYLFEIPAAPTEQELANLIGQLSVTVENERTILGPCENPGNERTILVPCENPEQIAIVREPCENPEQIAIARS